MPDEPKILNLMDCLKQSVAEAEAKQSATPPDELALARREWAAHILARPWHASAGAIAAAKFIYPNHPALVGHAVHGETHEMDDADLWRLRVQELAAAACTEAKQPTQPIPSESVWRQLVNHLDLGLHLIRDARRERSQ